MKYKLELQQTRTQNRPVTKEQVVSEGILGIEPRNFQLGDSTPNTLNQGFQSVLDSKETKTLFFFGRAPSVRQIHHVVSYHVGMA